MKDNEALLKTVFRIYTAHYEGAFIEVAKNGEGMIEIRTTDIASQRYFGKVLVSFEPEIAKKLAEAFRALT